MFNNATMLQWFPEADRFKEQLGESLRRESQGAVAVKLLKNRNVYNQGDRDGMIYFINSGQIKLLVHSTGGKECLPAIYTAGDIFGESCLAGAGERAETARVMENTTLRQIPLSRFMAHLHGHRLVEGFIRYLVARIAEQQRIIASFMTADSEYRLGEALLVLARKLGKRCSYSTRIEHKITHEELSGMVGTTRPRITELLTKFRSLGLIELSPDRSIIIHEKRLADYLAGLM